ECWYYVLNSSSDVIISTTTLSTCQNTTFKLPGGDIDYTLYLFAKDFLANTQSASVTFGIRTESPAISLSPINDSHRNYLNNHYFNFTISTNADSISSCSLYHNHSGTWEINQTDTSVSTTTTNSFIVNLSEIEFLWNVNCTDNLGTMGWGLNNQTYVVDLTKPNGTIDYITTTTGSQTFKFNTTVQDKYLLTTTCKYSIYNSLGSIDGLSNNISFNCNSETSATTTAYGQYNLTTYATDKATNENSTTKSFTTSATLLSVGGGGGVSENYVPVIALIKPNESTILSSNLHRAIIYSRINDFCEKEKPFFSLSKPPCSITEQDGLIANLGEQGIKLDETELDLWINAYNNQEIENVEVSKKDADKYDLDRFVIIFEKPPFKISPPSLTPFFIITSKDSIFEFMVQSAEPLKDVQLVEGELGLSVEKDDTTATVKYEILTFPPQYTLKKIEGTISYTSETGEVVYQKVSIRAIYFSFTLIIILISSIGLGIFGYVRRKDIKKFIIR
ncbi:MAG: hypothetical protein KKB31_01775, partial [Nanoarchaeota archaeon]|nr:hypothetical protein [Nanoarchaeota archaeon]